MFLPKPGLLVGNRYELTQPIGRGGMGEVWKAHDCELDTPCAVKFILQHLATDRGIRERFAREAKAVARLRSPHVVQILGVGEVEHVPYLAMELLSGETLLARLDRLGKLDPITTLKAIEQVGEALESAHQAGIVHRDLKPENVWFWSGSKVFVKVLDFGVAKTGMTVGSLQTATGALVGTPQYMSPEQALGNRDVDHRSDLWSLAVITVECLCGKRPFDSEGLGDLLLQIVSNKPPSLQHLAPELPAGLHEWWARALARDPRNRFQSATELVEALRPHLMGMAASLGHAPYSDFVHSGYAPSQPIHSGPVHSGLAHSGPAHSGPAHSGPAHSGPAHSGPAHSGPAHSGPAHSGPAHSGPAHSGPAHSGQPHSGQQHPGLPQIGLPHSAPVYSGRPSARPHEGELQARGPGATALEAGVLVGTPSMPVSDPLPTSELQPRSAERQLADRQLAEPHAARAHAPQLHAVQPHASGPSAPHAAAVHGAHPEAACGESSVATGVVSVRDQRPAGGSVGPISSSRRPAARDSRQRSIVIGAALLTAAVAGTAWRTLRSDDTAAGPSLPPPVPITAPEEAAGPRSADTVPSPAQPKPVAPELPPENPWERVLGGKPGKHGATTAIQALQPQQPQQSPDPAPTEPKAAAQPGATGTPPAAAAPEPSAPQPRATPSRAAPPPRPAPPAPKPARAPAPQRTAADIGLSAQPSNPGQSTAKPGSGAPGSAPTRRNGTPQSDEERKAALKRRIGLGSK